MPFTVDDTPFGSLSVTLADVDSTLAASIMATAPATLSLNVGTPGPGVPTGGTTGQVLKKVSGTDYDTAWQTDLNTGVWGSITGTLSNQTDLQTALNLKADLASPALTGTPTAPTAATLTSTTQIATTAFVQQELAAGTAVAKNLEVYVRNQSGATLAAGTIVYIDGATGNRPTVTKAQANNDANSAQTFGFTKTSIANNGFGYVIVRGELENVDTSALTEGQQLYLSPTTAGTWTTTKPSAPQHMVYVGIVVRAHPTQGIILVAIQNGLEIEELHNVSITTPTDGQVLKYEAATGLWKNGTDVGGVAWGGITGTLSNQTDLQTALDGKYSTSNPAGYITTSALTGYATESFVTSQGYITSSALSPYLLSSTAASTYYPLTGNPSGFLTSASLSGYATESWVNTALGSYLTTASASSTYLTQANAASTYQTQAGMSSYLTTASAASTYQTISGMSSYLTTSTAASTYAPLASPALTGTPTAPTAAVDTNTTQLATTAYVIGQGYLKSSTASSTYAPLASPTFTGTVTIPAGASISGFAPLASPALTGTPTAPTAAAATNTTQIATTAFVQQEVPVASTTAAGKVELATNAEAIAVSSTSIVPSLSNTPALITRPELRSLAHISSTEVAGTGTISAVQNGGLREMYLATLATGRAAHRYGVANSYTVLGSRANLHKIDFSKKIWMAGKSSFGWSIGATSYVGDANTICRITLGGYTAGFTDGDMTVRGIGLKKVGGTGSFINLTVHNGTTRTDVATTTTLANNEVFDWVIYSDGSGNVTLYINGTQVATTANGPTTATNDYQASYREQCECTTTPTVRQGFRAAGGWIYIEA